MLKVDKDQQSGTMPNLQKSTMAAITTYFHLYLIIGDSYLLHFGVYTHVFRGQKYNDNIHFSIEPFLHT